MIPNAISIESGTKNYRVEFVSARDEIVNQLKAIKNLVVITDKEIEKLYPDFINEIKEFAPTYAMVASEENKTLTGAEFILKQLQALNATKSTTIVAIGGGIIQDLVSFCTHIYYRGLPFVFIPTTLLAMCDSCIGGKNGLNYNGFKNQLGAFHPPEKVIIWSGFVNTLTKDAIYSGYGEIVKLMLIDSEEAYLNVKNTIESEGFNNSKLLDHIHQSLLIKKRFIEEDEFDNGVRRILNYGHTLGHALELATNYEVPHGIAVARGIDMVNFIASEHGLLPKAIYENIRTFIQAYFHCEMKPSVSAEILLQNARKDKKTAEGKLNMILMEDYGKFHVKPVLLNETLDGIVCDYLKRSQDLYC